MPACGFCKATILFGGVSDGPVKYCNQRCYQGAMLTLAADVVPPDLVDEAVHAAHTGACPVCEGAGPVDVHTSYFVWSAVFLTSWNNTPIVACRSCARKRQTGAMVGSAVLGWWGFPWGIVMTPVQVGRNIAAMAGGPNPAVPSEDLRRMVKMNMGARLMAMADHEQAAAHTPAAPPTAPPARR